MWDIRGWRRLTAHDSPALVAARDEFLAWLAEVPESPRVDLDARLRSESDDNHYSARLELFVHHYFRSSGWEVQVHPAVSHSPNHPDFLANKEGTKLYVECRSVFDRATTAQQDQRLRQLSDNAGHKLERAIILHPLSDLPPSIPAKRIRQWIQEQRIPNDSPDLLEFDLWDDHQGYHYGIRAILPKPSDQREAPTGVHGVISQATTISNDQQMRVALQEKASKYGPLDLPYVIAVSGETKFPMTTTHEKDALLGDRAWSIPQTGHGTVTETRNPNGFFILRRNNVAKHRDVSAVLVYRFGWLNEGHEHRMHIYHNPLALRPLNPDVFPGVPQMVPGDGTALKWLNGEPHEA